MELLHQTKHKEKQIPKTLIWLEQNKMPKTQDEKKKGVESKRKRKN